MIDYAEMEGRWQKAWRDAKVFEGDVNGKRSYFVTAAFPYANAPQHIGHLRTYGTADALARYKRMRGYNVLYPMAFHATGTPVLAFAKRIKNGDQSLVRELNELFHIPMQDIEKMTDPVFIANYFIGELEKGMRSAGYSIDWRRRFVSIDPFFSKFIEWQFGVLNGKGYLTKGKHPVGWCPNENNAVGMHDTRKDVEPEIEKVTAIKFRIESLGAYAVCTTFRPETIHGVTNLFVKEDARYVVCKANGKEDQLVISKASAETLRFQMSIDIIREIDGKELLKMDCTNPATGGNVPIFPGFFVDENRGTGLVMSVPGHAPFDYVAIKRLEKSGYDTKGVHPVKVIDVDIGRSFTQEEKARMPKTAEVPAEAYLAALGAGIDSTDEAIEAATKLQYKEESHWGRMAVEGYEGMPEMEARTRIKAMLDSKGMSLDVYVLMNESKVFCRCGYAVVVKVVDNQWFINYGNKEWKEGARKAFGSMKVLPERGRNAIGAAIEWIDLRAVVRAQGLGTRFPLDDKYIIESLSDSTLYMAFYTIANIIREVETDKLRPEFFDYVFLGKGNAEDVAKSTGIRFETVARCRESFDYWYNETSRHSGPDLIFNHLTMYLFNHVAVFDEKRWPKQIVVNGMVLSEGEKMSKSIGNIMPLMDGIARCGADPLRTVVIAGADLLSDSDYSDDAVNGVRERFEYLHGLCANAESYDTGELKHIDYWLYSKLNRKILAATESMEKLELRDAFTNVLYSSVLELKRYQARGGGNGIVLKDYLSAVSLMLQPLAPHVSEEFWHMLGNATFSSLERWPEADESMISDNMERGEELINETLSDAKDVMELMAKKGGKAPSTVRIIVADDWKRKLMNALAKERNIAGAMKKAKEMEGIDMEKASKYLSGLAKKIGSIRENGMTQEDELGIYAGAKEYMKGMLNADVEIEKESESGSQRAGRAVPLKPSIEIS